MKKDEIIRAWRDPDYFFALSDEQRSGLPENPAGMVELSDEALTHVLGATGCATCADTTECCPTNFGHTCDCNTCWSGSFCCC
jgi:mersacidin/lichenicidin family type 2 lantibiotic